MNSAFHQVVVVIVLQLASNFAWARDFIRIAPEYLVTSRDQSRVTLQDLVISEGSKLSPEMETQLKNVSLEIQGKDAIEFSDLQIALRSLEPRPQMIIPNEVKVIRPKLLTEKIILRKILKDLQGRCPSCEYQVRLNKVPEIPFEAELDVASIKNMGGFTMPVRTNPSTVTWITGTIQRFDLVPMVARNIQVGEVISPADVLWKRMDTTHVQDEIANLAIAQKSTAAVPLIPGNVLLARHFKKMTLVKRGQMVTAKLRSQDLEVNTSLEAKEDGTEGAVIQLKTPQGDRTMKGKVTSADEVEVL